MSENAAFIKKFNDYCADVMGYEQDFKDKDSDAYNPYYNLHQVAADVDELINLTGRYPEGDFMDSDLSLWKIWHNFVVSTMPNEHIGSDFDDFLEEEGILVEATEHAKEKLDEI